MKKVAFAHVEYVYDFDTKEEADRFIKEAPKGWNGWYFVTKEPEDNGDVWTVVVKKPYKNYNPGW